MNCWYKSFLRYGTRIFPLILWKNPIILRRHSLPRDSTRIIPGSDGYPFGWVSAAQQALPLPSAQHAGLWQWTWMRLHLRGPWLSRVPRAECCWCEVLVLANKKYLSFRMVLSRFDCCFILSIFVSLSCIPSIFVQVVPLLSKNDEYCKTIELQTMFIPSWGGFFNPHCWLETLKLNYVFPLYPYYTYIYMCIVLYHHQYSISYDIPILVSNQIPVIFSNMFFGVGRIPKDCWTVFRGVWICSCEKIGNFISED